MRAPSPADITQGIAAAPRCPPLPPCAAACSAWALRHIGTRRCTGTMGMAGQRLAGDLLGQRRWSPAASQGIMGIPGSSCRVTVPPSALPGAAVPSGMMSFPCWLWHCLLGHGCWPGDRERTVWAHGDGQMVSQGGGKVQLASLFYSPFLLQISILLRSSCA